MVGMRSATRATLRGPGLRRTPTVSKACRRLACEGSRAARLAHPRPFHYERRRPEQTVPCWPSPMQTARQRQRLEIEDVLKDLTNPG